MQKQLILLIYLDEVLADTQSSVSISLLEEISKSEVSNSLLTGGLWSKAVLQKLWAAENSW